MPDPLAPTAGLSGAPSRPLTILLQSRNLNAYALIVFGGLAFVLKMPESIYGGLILGGLAILKAGG